MKLFNSSIASSLFFAEVQIVISIPVVFITLSKLISGNITCSFIPIEKLPLPSKLAEFRPLKSKIKDKNISLEERISYQNKLNDLPRNGSAIRYRNRCEVTGRPRGNYRKFGLSRIKLRELSMSGDLPGVVKSSW